MRDWQFAVLKKVLQWLWGKGMPIMEMLNGIYRNYAVQLRTWLESMYNDDVIDHLSVWGNESVK